MTETATILDANGELARQHVELTPGEAQLLRTYKRFLEKYNLKEALYCGQCWDRDLADGCKAFVRPDRIMVQCRCTERYFYGATI